MRKYIKTGLLIVVLVVPVLIFIFLQSYTTNHFDLPYYVPLRDSLTNQVIRVGGDTAFYQIQDFSLILSDSLPTVATIELRGKTTVVSALMSPCDDVCRKSFSQLTRINTLHESYPSLHILTLTNIPAGDLAIHQKSGWQVVQLTDSVAGRVLRNVFQLFPVQNAEQTISAYNQFSLIDRDGFIRGYYNTRNPEDMERLLAEIRILEYNKKVEQP